MVADVLLRRRDYSERDLYDPRGRYGDIRWYPFLILVVATAVGFGMVTGTAGVGWLRWQGYLLGPLGLGGKHGIWSGADLGVVAAILIGFLATLVQRGRIRREESLDGDAHGEVPAVAPVVAD
jgi:NCS1 family nucleobase:cation symporter-1